MVRKVVRYPTAVLRAKCRPIAGVTEAVRTLATDMLETMREEHGVGLAAPQVAEDVQLTVIDVSGSSLPTTVFKINGEDKPLAEHMPLIILNPTIELGKAKVTDEEGCLSFPDLRGQIRRSADVKVTFQNLEGETVTIETDGLLARAFQHEIDHLNGILFIDRMSPAAKISLKRKLKRHMEEWAEEDEEERRKQKSA